MDAQSRARSMWTESDAGRPAPAGEPSREVSRAARAERRAYDPPRLERLGRFRALTLQQSVPIGPGGFAGGATGGWM